MPRRLPIRRRVSAVVPVKERPQAVFVALEPVERNARRDRWRSVGLRIAGLLEAVYRTRSATPA